MKTSLFSRIFTDNADDAEKLDNWIAEREIDIALREHNDDPLPFTVDADRLANAASSHDDLIEPGQIRILSADFVSDGIATPYIAVLDRWMEDIWLVAPFSPYDTPATDGEMATGIPLAGQHVLQCWNARTAHESLVGKSYVMGALEEKVRCDALALFRYVSAGAELPADFSALVGPPILSKADPRSEYIIESAMRYESLTKAAQKLEAKLAFKERLAHFKAELAERGADLLERLRNHVLVPAYAPDFALAAGDKAGQTVETFAIPSLGVELDVKHTPSEGKVRLVAYRDGERDSATLEGFVVVDKGLSPIGEIREGVLVAEASALAEGFILLHPETLEPANLVKKANQ